VILHQLQKNTPPLFAPLDVKMESLSVNSELTNEKIAPCFAIQY
jgi:hypothetical protein